MKIKPALLLISICITSLLVSVLFATLSAKSQGEAKTLKVTRVGKVILSKPLLFPAGTITTEISVTTEGENLSVLYSVHPNISADKMYAFYKVAYPEAKWLTYEKKDYSFLYVGKVNDNDGKYLFSIIINRANKFLGNGRESYDTADIGINVPKDKVPDSQDCTTFALPH